LALFEVGIVEGGQSAFGEGFDVSGEPVVLGELGVAVAKCLTLLVQVALAGVELGGSFGHLDCVDDPGLVEVGQALSTFA
jgi:hypothetical protein